MLEQRPWEILSALTPFDNDSVGNVSDVSWYQTLNDHGANWLNTIYGHSVGWVLMFVLLGTGIYFTIVSGAMQIRHFADFWAVLRGSRSVSREKISSFQAFAMGLADRVGTGSIAGVALAVVAGGAGAVFWMWVVAFVGMVTAFVEATLAQIFKVPNEQDGTFRGGPAYYIQNGLKSRSWGMVFAVLLLFAYGFTFQMTQANTVAAVAKASIGLPSWVSAIILCLMVAPFIIGGVKSIARISEYLAPIMALIYIALALVIIVMNYQQIPRVFGDIFAGAFGFRSVSGGIAGGLFAALINGIKRGLYTNEAGMGSAPNAAATASVDHPVTQGFIQALGVFIDTMLICSATAFIILVGDVYKPGSNVEDGAALTTDSMAILGSWTPILMLIIVLAFGYSTILGNYVYAEANWKFLRGINASTIGAKILGMIAVFLGSVLSLRVVWALTDWATALMAIVNLVAIVMLGRWALGALRDFESQRKAGVANPQFRADCEYLPGVLVSDAWPMQGASNTLGDETLPEQTDSSHVG